MAYARPVLCRLCRFPAPDGGVPVSQVDRKKLSEWCLRMMDTELDQEGLEKAVFCQFCLWECRFEFENCGVPLEQENRCVWWDNCRKDDCAEYSRFLEDKSWPCTVRITTLSKKILEQHGVFPLEKKLGPEDPKPQKKSYSCVYCVQHFPAKYLLEKHVQLCHQNCKKLKCSICKTCYFKSKQEKRKHWFEFHWRKVQCPYCPESFDTTQQLLKHAEKKHQNDIIRCTYHKHCAILFKTEVDRMKHVDEVHESGANRSKCVYCDKMVISRSMMRHVKTHHKSQQIRCTYNCSTFYHTEEERQKHILEIHESSDFGAKCKFCGKMVKLHNMELHVQTRHSNPVDKMTESSSPEGRTTCIYCNCEMKTPYLVGHMQMQHPVVAIKCNFNSHCPTYFLTLEDREQHLRLTHTYDRFDKFWCIYCEQYTSGRRINEHMRKQHPSQFIKCNHSIKCRTFFHTVEEREAHVREVHCKTNCKGKKVECVYCGVKVVYVCTHVSKVHSQINTFKCRSCSAFFLSDDQRSEHFQKKHSEQEKKKVLKCNKCEFATNHPQSLQHHDVHKHGTREVSSKCFECRKVFKSSTSLKFHLRKFHP